MQWGIATEGTGGMSKLGMGEGAAEHQGSKKLEPILVSLDGLPSVLQGAGQVDYPPRAMSLNAQ